MEVRMKIYRVVMLVRKENIGKEMTYATLEKENQWAKKSKIIYSVWQQCMLDSHNYDKLQVQMRQLKH